MRRFLILFAGTVSLLGLTAMNASATNKETGVFDKQCGEVEPGDFRVKDFQVATTNPYGSEQEFTEPSGDPNDNPGDRKDREGIGVALGFCTIGSRIYDAPVIQPDFGGYPTHYRNLLCPYPAVSERHPCYNGWSLNRTISIALPPGMRVKNTVECKWDSELRRHACDGRYIVGKISGRILTWGQGSERLVPGMGGFRDSPIGISNNFNDEPRVGVDYPRPQDITPPDELVACWSIGSANAIWVVRDHDSDYGDGTRDVMTFGQSPGSLEQAGLAQLPAGITAIEVRREKEKGGKEPEPEPGLYLCGKLGESFEEPRCGSGEDPVLSWNGYPAETEKGCGPDAKGMWQAHITTLGFYAPDPKFVIPPQWTDE